MLSVFDALAVYRLPVFLMFLCYFICSKPIFNVLCGVYSVVFFFFCFVCCVQKPKGFDKPKKSFSDRFRRKNAKLVSKSKKDKVIGEPPDLEAGACHGSKDDLTTRLSEDDDEDAETAPTKTVDEFRTEIQVNPPSMPSL
jgi:hypothetical protein